MTEADEAPRIRPGTGSVGASPVSGDPLRGLDDEALKNAESWAMISRVASYIAHELGTPLNVISGRATMISSGEATAQEAVDNAKIIVEQSSKLTTIIRQFLAEARKPAKRESTDVDAVCRRAITHLAPFADKHRVRVVHEASSRAASVEIDPLKLLQVANNLITNAIQSMKSSGGTVTVSVSCEKKHPGGDTTRPGSDCVCLVVRDEGHGIEKDDLQKVFKLFYSTRSPSEGTGLGLSIVQGIVRENSGTIDVESEPGKGTAFKVCLPEGGN